MIKDLLANQKDLEKIAVIEKGGDVRYIDLLKKALRLRGLLPNQQGSVAILLPNGSNYIAAFWGAVMSGMTAFPLSVLMTGHEILPLFKQARVTSVITESAYGQMLLETSGFHELALKVIYIDRLAPAPVNLSYEPAPPVANRPMMLLSTSGTTGRSKIVMLSEKNVEAAVLGYLDKLRFDEAESFCIRYTLSVPFSSVYGMMIICACLMKAFPLVVLEDAFTLDSLYLAAEKYKITHYEGSASTILLMEQMAGREIPYDASTLRYFGFGGSRVSGRTIENVMKSYPESEFFQGYGMTEASPLIAKHPQKELLKTGSVGTAIKGVEIAVETSGGITTSPGIMGEIVIRGPVIMLGYLGNEEETARILKNGYLYTGDIGYLDDDGYLYICGREKNIIIVRGFNVHPEEVEECIQSSKLAYDCIVYGETDDLGNEVVCAGVVPIDPNIKEDDIRCYCKSHLAEYKRPQRIFLLESIRKSPSGKTLRR